MANNVGTLVIAPIRPQSDVDLFPTAFANEIRGGHHQVSDVTERNNISTDRLEIGMLCTTQDDSKIYMLKQITPSLVWEEIFSGYSNAIGGSVDLNISDYVYSVTHAAISGTPLPMVTLVSPDEFSTLFIDSVTNVTNNGFDIVLSHTPPTSGYKINWTNGPLDTVSIEATTNVYSGVIDLDTVNNIYVVPHTDISGTPTPVVSIVAPSISDLILSHIIVDVQMDQFTVVLSDTPEVSGYKMNWMTSQS